MTDGRNVTRPGGSGLPGFAPVERGGTLQTTALEISEGHVVGVCVVRNPEMFRHLAGESSSEAPG